MRGIVSIERLALVLIAAVALAGFVVSPALGGPGFLTKKKANKLYLKKKDASRLFLSKGDADSRFLAKGDADSRFPAKGEVYTRPEADSRFLRPEGEIRIVSGPTNWVLGPTFAGPDPSVAYFSDSVRLRSSAEATAFAQITPELPAVLYGRPMKFVGAEFCYTATANARLNFVSLAILTESEKLGIPDVAELVLDGTTRTDDACRTYKAASPVTLGAGDFPVLGVGVNYPTNTLNSDILLGRASFILQP
jgi:hypothetical protein